MQQISRVPRYQNLETLTKLICTASILTASALQNALVSRDSMIVAVIGSLAFAGGMLFSRRFPNQLLSLCLLFLYIMPGLISFLFHETPLYNPLVACLLGIFLSTSNFRSWDFPSVWKIPLVLWFLVIALSWPVILLREVDYAPALTLRTEVFNNKLMTSSDAAVWILSCAVTQGLGFLWIDWLFAIFKNSNQKRFRTYVIGTLGVSFLISCVISFYQAFFDIRFLNTPFWINLRRLTGGFMDANSFGVLAALWGPGLALFALSWQSRTRAYWIVSAMALSWLTVMFSGSRSGFIIITMCTFYMAWLGIRQMLKKKQMLGLLTASACIVIIAALIWLFVPATISTPIQRIRVSASEDSVAGIWNSLLAGRLDYGRVGMQMIRDMPWTGLGLGSFNILVGGYSKRYGFAGAGELPVDNALNWYLNQFAEFGLLGSIGWMMWIIVFIRTLFVGFSKSDITGKVLSCMLLSFGIASLFGVHSERVEVLLTFWVLVFWIWTHLEQFAGRKNFGEFLQESSKTWIVILILGGTFAALHAYKGMDALRVPFRAAQEGWDYTYGFYPWESTIDAGSFRWTKEKAVAVIPVDGARLRLTTWVDHPDVTKEPVHLQIRMDQKLTVDTWIRDHRKLIREIELPRNRTHTVMTIRINPTWCPADYGFNDLRRLGAAIADWEFLPPTTN